jgi:hypothetical protein
MGGRYPRALVRAQCELPGFTTLDELTEKIRASHSAAADPGHVLACAYARGSGPRPWSWPQRGRRCAGMLRGPGAARGFRAWPGGTGGWLGGVAS